MLSRRFACAVIAFFSAFFLIADVQAAIAHGEPGHDADLKNVLFDGGDSGNEEALDHLEEAMYLCLDFNSMEPKGGEYLENLRAYGVAGLPDKPDDINLPGGSKHQKYTHRGWDKQSTYFQGEKNAELKKKWELRKEILINTSYKVFGYSPAPGFLAWTPLGDEGREKKHQSFAALVYYVHVLGDYVAIEDEHWKSFSVHATKIPFASPERTGDIDIFSELEKHLAIVFADQKDGYQYDQLLKDIDGVASKSRKLAGSEGGINTLDKFQEAHGYAVELMDVLSGKSGHANRVHDLLMYEESFTNAFPSTGQATTSGGWIEGVLEYFGIAA